jgi:hypothetical protein
MNCPECDLLTYQAMCSCGWVMPPITKIEVKLPDTKQTNYPLNPDVRIKQVLSEVRLTGKPYAEYCIDYAKKILRGEIC